MCSVQTAFESADIQSLEGCCTIDRAVLVSDDATHFFVETTIPNFVKIKSIVEGRGRRDHADFACSSFSV